MSIGNELFSSDIDVLLKYFPGLTVLQQKQFAELPQIYADWNEKINVVSRKDIDQLLVHHILHSLSIAKVVSFVKGTTIIDIGTGGGFPGIPLAILFPDADFFLVDSIGKKISVVNEIITALKLENVKGYKCRAEEVEGEFDFVVSRAVASIKSICHWTRHMKRIGGQNSLKNGWLFLKGGNLVEEIRESDLRVKTFEISNFFVEDFFQEKKIIYIPFR